MATRRRLPSVAVAVLLQGRTCCQASALKIERRGRHNRKEFFMPSPEKATSNSMRRHKILLQLQDGVHTWDELRALTKINDDNLGFTVGELLNAKKIWTGHRGAVRVYGLERRTGLTPRFAHEQKRADDLLH